MSYSAKDLLGQCQITINPKTEKETESRWNAIKEMRKTVKTTKLADHDICLVNTAGKDHTCSK